MGVTDDFLDFLPLVVRTEEDVRAQFDSDANAYLGVGDAPIDTSEPSFFFLNTQPSVMEFARAYDDLGTSLAASFVPFAWGQYLDYHGQQLRTPRKGAVIARGTVDFEGVDGTLIGAGTRLTPTQVDPDIDVPTFVTTATVTIASGVARDVPIEAVDPGLQGNVSTGAIDVIRTPNDGLTSVTNTEPTTDGADIESDEDYRYRLMLASAGSGPGNINDYVRWGLEELGVGRVTVQAAWNGPNSVMSTLMARDGSPVSSVVVDRHQARMDPVPGQGRGVAPVGAFLLVNTPTLVLVDVTARMTFETGYSLDGTGGTIALQPAIESALNQYLDQLDVGEDVVKNHVEAQFFTVEGVHDVSLTAPAADVPVNGAINPPEVARTGRITLT